MTEWRVKRSELTQVAKFVAHALRGSSPFVLWLRGELGAGKTAFTGELLRALGLPETIPVLSPTYTFMTEYHTDLGLVAHLDLYRLSENDHDAIEFLLSDRDFAGLVIEWPERAPHSSRTKKTHELILKFTENLAERVVQFHSGG